MARERQFTGRSGGPRGQPKEMMVAVPSAAIMQDLVGEADKNLRYLEDSLGLSISRNDQGLVLRGLDSDVDLGADLLSQLIELLQQGEGLHLGDFERSLKMLSQNHRARLQDLFREQLKIAGRKQSIVPKNFTQRSYIEAIRSYDLVFGIGPAGTGKTYLAMAMAVTALLNKQVKRIVLCRPAVEAGEKLGFLPGDMAEKVNPYLRPLYDALYDMVETERAEEMIERGVIEVAPLAFMRGRTLHNAFAILDEAQNTTSEQMKMFLTRLGPESKSVVTGDVTQVDLPRGIRSGLVEALTVLKEVQGLRMVHFAKEDIIRHPLVGKIVAAYESSTEARKE
jgi:phosphate starvation-inducible PhoH-like protein